MVIGCVIVTNCSGSATERAAAAKWLGVPVEALTV